MAVAAWEVKAQMELGETPEGRIEAVKELRDLIENMNDPKFVARTDDEFLIRFIRVRKYNVRRAFKSYKRYFQIRMYDPKKYMQVGAYLGDYLEELGHQIGTIIRKKNPSDGTIILIWRLGTWNPHVSNRDFGDLVTPTIIALDHMFRDDATQVQGMRVIVDFKGLELEFIKYVPLSFMRVLFMALHDGYPARFKGFHIVHNNAFFTHFYSMLVMSVSKKLRQRLRVHGSDMSDLHKYIDRTILPEEYGGCDGVFDNKWIVDEILLRDDEVEELSHFGYGVKDRK